MFPLTLGNQDFSGNLSAWPRSAMNVLGELQEMTSLDFSTFICILLFNKFLRSIYQPDIVINPDDKTENTRDMVFDFMMLLV